MPGTSSGPLNPLRLLALAAWAGLGYGLLEGLESFLLSRLPQGLSWQNGNSVDALLFMPPLYLAAYLLLSLPVVALALLRRRPWWDVVLLFLLASLSGYLFALNQGAVFSHWASAMLGIGIGTVVVRGYRRQLDRWRARTIGLLPMLIVAVTAVMGITYLGKRLSEAAKLAALPPPGLGRPNLLLIILDTQRAENLSSYGYRRRTTPHIDSLAASGTLFERAFATSSWTLPTHASMFTGLNVHQHGAGAGGDRFLQRLHPTIAERLAASGYATAAFVANTFWAGRHTGLDRGFIHYEDFYGTPGDALQRMTLVRAVSRIADRFGVGNVKFRGRKRARDINRDFLQWVDRSAGRPFFVFLNYMDVHAPYLPPASHLGRFGSPRAERREERGSPSAEELASRIDRYDESLAYLDEQIGRLMGELKERGIFEHTVVVVTSDHGEHFGEHGLTEHGKSLYVQETHVPLIIRVPGATASRRVSWPVSMVRLAATLGELGTLANSPFPGPSLLAGSEAEPVLSEMGSTGVGDSPSGQGWLKSLVSDQWHFILREGGKGELYDLSADPGELTDLAGTAAGLVRVPRLRQELARTAQLEDHLKEGEIARVIE